MSIIRALAFDSQVQEVGEELRHIVPIFLRLALAVVFFFFRTLLLCRSCFLSSCPKLAWGFLQRESVPS